jgi:solute carrier family 13 (sodium-dependent dicarboxylate transporter), member 2/3/5
VAISLLTIGLWVTSDLHGVPAAVVSLLPLLAFFGLRYLEPRDFSGLSWNVLFIVGGGLSLGLAMEKTGVTAWLAGLLKVSALPPLALLFLVCLVTLVLSTFISHSAVANLLAPLAAAMPVASPVMLTMACALAASTGHALPVSTPPNAIAYSSGEIKLKEMAWAGGIASLVSALLIGLYIFGLQLLFAK